jgi:hypothetical protein
VRDRFNLFVDPLLPNAMLLPMVSDFRAANFALAASPVLEPREAVWCSDPKTLSF